MATKAVSYLRVSGKGQVDGDGFPRQRDAIARYAAANGVNLVDEYLDAGVSGTKELENRAGLAQLLDRLESNGVKLVIIERADRLARDLIVSEAILDQFIKIGVKVVSADGTDLTAGDSSNPEAKFHRQIMGAAAELEKNILVLKLKAARGRKRRETGKCEGRKAYGEITREIAGLDRIKKLARKPRDAKRRSCGVIAQLLNVEGVPSRTGKPWNRGTVWTVCKRNGWR
jgi:DNA invertase Pin-like site-specific DNA recombinase